MARSADGEKMRAPNASFENQVIGRLTKLLVRKKATKFGLMTADAKLTSTDVMLTVYATNVWVIDR